MPSEAVPHIGLIRSMGEEPHGRRRSATDRQGLRELQGSACTAATGGGPR